MEKLKTVKIYLEGEDWVIRIVSVPTEADVVLKDGILTLNGNQTPIKKECPIVKVTVCSNKLETEISNLIFGFGIPANIKGYRYIREALKIIINDPESMNSITKIVYPKVAQIFNTQSLKAERAIRHAILTAFSRENISLKKYFPQYPNSFGKIKPTNSEFLSCIAENFRLTNTTTD